MTSLKQLLRWGQSNLEHASESANLDSEILLCHVLRCARVFLYSHPEKQLDEQTIQTFTQLIESRKTGYPIAYLTGEKAFWSLDLEVNEHTLIPRPETELLVEQGLERIKSIRHPRIIDLGTGSGAIALAIAYERPDAEIIAVDLSFSALQMAHTNQQRHQLTQIEFICASWFSAIKPDEQFDLVISNPPYIAETDPHLKSDIRYEPHQALASGPEGLDAIIPIISESVAFLKPNGWLLIEHGYDQREPITKKLIGHHYQHVSCWQDQAGLDRVSGGQKSP